MPSVARGDASLTVVAGAGGSIDIQGALAGNDGSYDLTADQTLDVNERRTKIEICEKILQDDAIIPQPFWRTVYKAVSKRVKGHETHPTLYHQFHNVWLDQA